MCKQCKTRATMIRRNVLPGYTLMQAQRGADTWPAGWYGLVRSNDPDFTFPAPMAANPFGNGYYPSEEWTPEQDTQYEAFIEYIKTIQPLFQSDPLTGSSFVDACRKAGYTNTEGDPIAWFVNHAAEQVRDNPPPTLEK